MNQTLTRLGAACGIAPIVLVFAGTGAGTEQVELVGFVLLIPFVAYVSSLIGGWIGIAAFGGGIAGATLKLGSVAPWLAREEHVEGSAVYEALDGMASIATVIALYPMAILTAAIALAAFVTHVFPRWLGAFSALLAVGLLVNAMSLETEFVPALPLFLLWAFVLGVKLLIRPVHAAGTAPAPATGVVTPSA